MKRRDDGYVLIYVLIVVVLLAALAAAAGTVAVRNITAQRAAEARTREKYEAVGMIERMRTHLDGLALQTGAVDVSEEIGSIAREYARSSYSDGALEVGTVTARGGEYRVSLTATRGEMQITAELVFSARDGQIVFVRYDAYEVRAMEAV